MFPLCPNSLIFHPSPIYKLFPTFSSYSLAKIHSYGGLFPLVRNKSLLSLSLFLCFFIVIYSVYLFSYIIGSLLFFSHPYQGEKNPSFSYYVSLGWIIFTLVFPLVDFGFLHSAFLFSSFFFLYPILFF